MRANRHFRSDCYVCIQHVSFHTFLFVSPQSWLFIAVPLLATHTRRWRLLEWLWRAFWFYTQVTPTLPFIAFSVLGMPWGTAALCPDHLIICIKVPNVCWEGGCLISWAPNLLLGVGTEDPLGGKITGMKTTSKGNKNSKSTLLQLSLIAISLPLFTILTPRDASYLSGWPRDVSPVQREVFEKLQSWLVLVKHKILPCLLCCCCSIHVSKGLLIILHNKLIFILLNRIGIPLYKAVYKEYSLDCGNHHKQKKAWRMGLAYPPSQPPSFVIWLLSDSNEICIWRDKD